MGTLTEREETMIACNCVVQAGQIPAPVETALRTALDAFAQKSFGAKATINWTVVPPNSGYTAGVPSTSAVVSMRSNTALQQSKREALLRELCDIWSQETKCSLDEVVGVISDPQLN